MEPQQKHGWYKKKEGVGHHHIHQHEGRTWIDGEEYIWMGSEYLSYPQPVFDGEILETNWLAGIKVDTTALEGTMPSVEEIYGKDTPPVTG